VTLIKAKVYKIPSFTLDDETGRKYLSGTEYDTLKPNPEKLALIKCGDQFVIFDNEAIHTVSTPFNVNYYRQGPGNTKRGGRTLLTFECIPCGEAGLVPGDLEEHGTLVDEVDPTDFVRVFGSRIENNYHILVSSIKEIGTKGKLKDRTSRR